MAEVWGEVRLPLGLYWHGWKWGYIFFYGVLLKHSGYCLGVFCFVNLLVPGPLAKKYWLLLGLLKLSIGCSEFLASSAPCLGYMTLGKKRKNTRNSSLCHSQVPSWPAAFSPPLRPSHVCFIYKVQSFSLFGGRIGKSMPMPSSQRKKSF